MLPVINAKAVDIGTLLNPPVKLTLQYLYQVQLQIYIPNFNPETDYFVINFNDQNQISLDTILTIWNIQTNFIPIRDIPLFYQVSEFSQIPFVSFENWQYLYNQIQQSFENVVPQEKTYYSLINNIINDPTFSINNYMTNFQFLQYLQQLSSNTTNLIINNNDNIITSNTFINCSFMHLYTQNLEYNIFITHYKPKEDLILENCYTVDLRNV